jgi:organizing structure protein 2
MPLLQLPIYPTADADRPVTLIEAPHPLTPYIAQARETTTDALSGACKYVEAGVSKWIGFERKVESESSDSSQSRRLTTR